MIAAPYRLNDRNLKFRTKLSDNTALHSKTKRNRYIVGLQQNGDVHFQVATQNVEWSYWEVGILGLDVLCVAIWHFSLNLYLIRTHFKLLRAVPSYRCN